MSTAAVQVSPALAGHFNTAFHASPALVRDRAHAILKALLGRCAKEGVAFEDEALVAGVEAAIEALAKNADTNPVAYAFATARREDAGAIERKALADHEAATKPALRPLGQPTVRIMGLSVPAGIALPSAWEAVIEDVLAASGATGERKGQIRGVLTMIQNGWRLTPPQAVRALAAGLAAGVDNDFAWCVAELEQLEAAGIECARPEQDPFLGRIASEMKHRRDVPAKARERFYQAVRLQADHPRFYRKGEVVVDLKRLGTGFVLMVWGRWAGIVANAIRSAQNGSPNDPIPHPHPYLSDAADREMLGEPKGDPQTRFDGLRAMT